jgi:hypothetical protein
MTATTHGSTSDPASFLRKSLRGNAIFSILSGLTFVAASGTVAQIVGAVTPIEVVVVGAQLLLFAGALLFLASRPEVSARLAIGVIVADLLWVIGTIGVVYAELLTSSGAVLVIVIADIVLLMAILQSIGVRKMTQAKGAASA